MLDTEREYTISEVSDITGYPTHVLRYYEKEFDMQIPRNEANHRYYTYSEIEILNYIKELQEKGFTNKQIKLIMNSPEMLINGQEETAVTSLNKKENHLVDISQEILTSIQKIIINELEPKLIERENKGLRAIEELKEEVIELRNEINSKERDVLICENAKLKMKMKERAYETAELKEKLKREQNSNKSIFRKIFKVK